MEIVREMERVLLDLTLLAEQGKVWGGLYSVRSANKLGNLLEDVRGAMVDYQVRMPIDYFVFHRPMFEPDFIATRNL